MRRATLVVLFVLLGIPIAVAGKRSNRVRKGQDVIQVTMRMVQVTVIVKDRHGKLVPGSTSNDFTIYDDGKPQRISDFVVEQTHQPPALPPVPPDFFTTNPERLAGGSPAVT